MRTRTIAFRSIFAIIALALPAAVSAAAGSVSITGPTGEQMLEGNVYTFSVSGQSVSTVSIVASGQPTTIPGRNRPRFSIVIAQNVPPSTQPTWKVPFLDTVRFRVTAKDFDSAGNMVAKASRVYLWRPGVLRTRTADGIYVDVRRENRQRLYVLKDNKLTREYLTSGARQNEFYPRNVHPDKPHDHYGVFKVAAKYPKWHSKLFDVDMTWAMLYWNGHFIHGTSRNEYRKLGTAASSGCNRLTKAQAKQLYDMTPVGTRVEIIAK